MREFRTFQWVRQWIYRHTQAEWLEIFFDTLRRLRDWADAHGQKALTFGLLAGFFVAVFFKIFVLMLALSCILAVLVYELAPEKREEKQSSPEKEP
jgi:hypothetical protein